MTYERTTGTQYVVQKSGPWTEEEDAKLTQAVQEIGGQKGTIERGGWIEIATRIPGRTNEQCYKRWNGYINPKIKKGKWSSKEDELLRETVEELGTENWTEIAKRVPGRTNEQCYKHWNKGINPKIKKGRWSSKEDELLRKTVGELGTSSWAKIAKRVQGRTSKQCRERWNIHLNPNLDKKEWTPEECKLLIEKQREHGNRWNVIATYFPGRSRVSIKNHWHRLQRRKGIQNPQGQPIIHQPPQPAQSTGAEQSVVGSPVTFDRLSPSREPNAQSYDAKGLDFDLYNDVFGANEDLDRLSPSRWPFLDDDDYVDDDYGLSM